MAGVKIEFDPRTIKAGVEKDIKKKPCAFYGTGAERQQLFL